MPWIAGRVAPEPGLKWNAPSVDTPLTGIKVWMGQSWQLKPCRVWDGQSWATKPLKYWDGTTWAVSSL